MFDQKLSQRETDRQRERERQTDRVRETERQRQKETYRRKGASETETEISYTATRYANQSHDLYQTAELENFLLQGLQCVFDQKLSERERQTDRQRQTELER